MTVDKTNLNTYNDWRHELLYPNVYNDVYEFWKYFRKT